MAGVEVDPDGDVQQRPDDAAGAFHVLRQEGGVARNVLAHVAGEVHPIADIETIETELMLADLDSLEKRVTALEKKMTEIVRAGQQFQVTVLAEEGEHRLYAERDLDALETAG